MRPYKRQYIRPVSMTVRFHLFPFRTQKLSSLVPTIVGWKRPVKIGRCRLLFSICWDRLPGASAFGRRILIYAPLAQLVEQLTLNQWVLGSSPRWRTKDSLAQCAGLFFCCCIPGRYDFPVRHRGREQLVPAACSGGHKIERGSLWCLISRKEGLHHPLRGSRMRCANVCVHLA